MFLEVLRRCVSALDSSRAQCTCWPARLVVGSSVLHTDSVLMNDVVYVWDSSESGASEKGSCFGSVAVY